MKMAQLEYMNLIKTLSIEDLALVCLLFLSLLYFLTSRPIVSLVLVIVLNSYKLINAIDIAFYQSKKDPTTISEELGLETAGINSFEVDNNEISYTTISKDPISNLQPSSNPSTPSQDSPLSPNSPNIKITNHRLMSQINKMNIGLLRTNVVIPKRGLLFNINPIRGFTTSNIIKNDFSNFNNIPKPNLNNKNIMKDNTIFKIVESYGIF